MTGLSQAQMEKKAIERLDDRLRELAESGLPSIDDEHETLIMAERFGLDTSIYTKILARRVA